ncbi:MAG: cation:proton antiporter [Acidimicrobiia bacterium]
MDVSFANLAMVAAVAFVTPLALGLVPRLRLPDVVVEIVLGIVLGPAVLGWVEVDNAVRVLSVIGLAFLLFLGGLELDVRRLGGQSLRLAGLGFALSILLAIAAAAALDVAELADAPLLIAVILTATGLGLVVPVLKDAGQAESTLGQLVLASASIADFAAVVLLSLLFSEESGSAGSRAVLLVGFVVVVVAIAVMLAESGMVRCLSATLLRLQDTTAQIRVRGAVLLLIVLAFVAERFGLEAILGAFVAGAVVSVVDRDALHTHPHFRLKLESVGFGFVVPVFFVASGITFDLDALLDDPATLARVPIYLGALLVVRGVPAFLYRSLLGRRETIVAGLLQATSLPFIVAATQIGLAMDLIEPGTAAALVAAGLLSALVFPVVALALLGGRDDGQPDETSAAVPTLPASNEDDRPDRPAEGQEP